MGSYLNPDNIKFQRSLNSEIYVDKSDLIAILNKKIHSDECYICISRPRRFGKSLTANMLSAYYAKGIDSSDLFKNLKISSDSSYQQHLNKHNVIFINMQNFLSNSNFDVKKMLIDLDKAVINEIECLYPDIDLEQYTKLNLALTYVYDQVKEDFIFIIDEWDCILREKKEDTTSFETYLDYLRTLFKDQPYIALAYMTGILPIKKYGTHSALNMFKEYSMIYPLDYASYIGFTENEIQPLCDKYSVDFEQLQQWYDGYIYDNSEHIYNPNSVVNALQSKCFLSYWTKTEIYEALQFYIDINMDGLKEAIIKLIAGNEVLVDTTAFHNDMSTFKDKDDILTLLVHLGYLAVSRQIQEEEGEFTYVKIPNKEIRYEFFKCLRKSNSYVAEANAITESKKLLSDILNGDQDSVARTLDVYHQNNSSILKYNDENSLACIISISMIHARNYYNEIRELPAGKGFADIAYLPKVGTDKPALIVELKYDKSAESAIKQIKDKKYAEFFKDYCGDVLLVGINYDKTSKKHQCIIEKISM